MVILLHLKERVRPVLACFHGSMMRMMNGNMDVAIKKAMVVWVGALSTRSTMVAGDIAQKVVQVCCKSKPGLLNIFSKR